MTELIKVVKRTLFVSLNIKKLRKTAPPGVEMRK